MDPELPLLDDVSRFTTLRDESLKLLDAARSSIGEMRTALEECKLYRPVVDVCEPTAGQPARQAARSHRGGRVTKKHRHRCFRRPR